MKTRDRIACMGFNMIAQWLGGTVPLRVQYIAILADPEELVEVGDGVEVGILAIQEESVGFPDVVQHFDARAYDVEGSNGIEGQTRVLPFLSEVAIQREHLEGDEEPGEYGTWLVYVAV